MPTYDIPEPIRQLAEQRASARRARDWATADRLKAELEAAGWRVVDAGTLYSLERLPPSVTEVDGVAHYGASAAVPSRLDEPAGPGVTFVVVASDRAGVVARALDAVERESPGSQAVVVANAPSDQVAAELAALRPVVEIVRLGARLGAAAAWNAGIRRAAREVVVLLDPSVEVRADAARLLTAALADPTVAVAGIAGLVTEDLVHFGPSAAGERDAVAIDGRLLAFRRDDFAQRGPIDEHFVAADYLDVWWSLVLRDVADDADPGAVPRRAVVVPVPAVVHGAPDRPTDERTAKRARYRYLRSFATRRDLLARPS